MEGLFRRRSFLKSILAAGTLAATGESLAQPAADSREYYHLRRYQLSRGPGEQICAQYFAHSLIPALNRLGFAKIGVFSLDIGPETPVLYLLITGSDLSRLVNVHESLQKDDDFMKNGAPFWSAPASSPVYESIESHLLSAFHGWPKLTPPPAGSRIFQLRTYESPCDRDHLRKIEEFHSGEFEIFARSGAKQVFYGDALIAPRMPSLTYMLSFADLAELDAVWNRFRNDAQWKKLSADSRYGFEPIVSKTTNLVLRPTEYSQI
jgi:hypothetical protein